MDLIYCESMKKILTIAALFLFISSSQGQDDLPFKSSEEFKVITSFQLVTLQAEKKPDLCSKVNVE